MPKKKFSLIGRRIVEIRLMTKDETFARGWDYFPGSSTIVIKLDDGTVLYAAQDSECNGPGAFFGWDSKGNEFRIQARPGGDLYG